MLSLASTTSLQAQKLLSVSMPNQLNFAFDYNLACQLIMVIYPFGFYMLYSYMIAQRGKKLAEAKQKSE